MGRFCWAIPIVVVASHAQAQLSLRTVAMTGDACPGSPPGGVITSFADGGTSPGQRINNSGRVAFQASCSDTTNSMILTEGHGSLESIRVGAQVTNHGTLNLVQGPRIDDAGDVVFLGGLGPQLGIITNQSGPLSAIAITGDPAPGADANFESFSADPNLAGPPSLSRSGQSVFYATLTDTSRGVWSNQGGSLGLTALEGSAVPGHPGEYFDFNVEDSLLLPFEGPAINSNGDIAFGRGAWVQTSAGFRRVVPSAKQDPSNCQNTENPVINNAAQVAYLARCTGLPGTPQVIKSESAGALHSVTSSTDSPPGMPVGSVFRRMSNPVLTSSGHTVFHSTVTTPDNQSRDAYFAEDAQGLVKLLVAEAMQVPGMPDGVTFDYLLHGTPSANSLGHVVFSAAMLGPGVSSRGIWLSDINTGELSPLLSKGQMLEIYPGVFRQISNLYIHSYYNGGSVEPVIIGSGGEDGRPSSLNEEDQFAFKAYFTDGSSGIFVATIPEPAAAAIVSLLGLALLGRKNRRL